MSPEITVIDAGPTLNFLCSGQIGLLLSVLDGLHTQLVMPAEVEAEVIRKSNERGGSSKFAGAAKKLDSQVRGTRISVLPSSVTDQSLMQQVQRVAGTPFQERVKTSKDLGEVMVVAQVLRLQQDGKRVIALIDDNGGRRLANRYHVQALTTVDVLELAVRMRLVSNRGEMREIYDKLARYDDGLASFETTRLNAKSLYRQSPL